MAWFWQCLIDQAVLKIPWLRARTAQVALMHVICLFAVGLVILILAVDIVGR